MRRPATRRSHSGPCPRRTTRALAGHLAGEDVAFFVELFRHVLDVSQLGYASPKSHRVSWRSDHELVGFRPAMVGPELDETASAELDLAREPALPARISRFAITGSLGAGGMGIVMLAIDPLLGREVALKVMREQQTLDRLRYQRFLREAQTMAKLVHENVVVVHEVGTHEDQIYVAMEYVAGSTLARWQVGRAWRDIVAVYVRAGRGLAFAHDAGFVHRDFKPENVLVGDDGRVRVTDFGLAAIVGAPIVGAELGNVVPSPSPSLTRTGAVMGTPRYMAPEQHLGEPVDARADQFSFCVALYEALYEQPPFEGKEYAALAYQVLHERPRQPPVSEVPLAIQRAILRGLARHPSDRFASMHELLAVLHAPPRRRLRWIARAVAVAVAIAIVAVLALRFDDSAAPVDAVEDNLQPPIKRMKRVQGHAKVEYEAGQADYLAGRYATAATEFMAAYRYSPRPEFLYNAAAAYHSLGRSERDADSLRRAAELFRRYLAEAPDTSDRPRLLRYLREIDTQLAAP